jgi:hypothetical protein
VNLGEPFLRLECRLLDLDLETLMRVAHQVIRVVTRRLELPMDAAMGLEVLVGDGPNDAQHRSIRVSPKPAGRGYGRYDWFELLFSHELTHVLVESAWGRPPLPWWEGLPVALGDDRVRTRLFGRSYHARCRALDELGMLLPMQPLLRASYYYAARTDSRVDVQAGSLCAFGLEVHGPAALRAFVGDVRLPTPEDPRLVLEPALRRHVGADFEGHVEDWLQWLRATVPLDDALLEQLVARSAEPPPRRGRIHCDFCYTPLEGEACPACGGVPVPVPVV